MITILHIVRPHAGPAARLDGGRRVRRDAPRPRVGPARGPGVLARGHLGGAARPDLPRRGAGPRRDPGRRGRAACGASIRSSAPPSAPACSWWASAWSIGGRRSATTPASACCSSGCCPSASSSSPRRTRRRWSSSCSATSPTSTGATSRCRRSRSPRRGGRQRGRLPRVPRAHVQRGRRRRASAFGPHLTNIGAARLDRGGRGVVVPLGRAACSCSACSSVRRPRPCSSCGECGCAWWCRSASGWLAVAVGLLLARHYDTAVGATMAAVSVGLFFVVLAAQSVRRSVAPFLPA